MACLSEIVRQNVLLSPWVAETHGDHHPGSPLPYLLCAGRTSYLNPTFTGLHKGVTEVSTPRP